MFGKNKESACRKANRINDPILTSGIGSRISDLAKKIGGTRHLAEVINMSEAQLYRITSEKSMAKVETVAAIAAATSVSIDWLATGKEPEPVDQASEEEHAYRLKMMLDTVETVEENCIKKNMNMEPAEKALLIKRIYEYLLKYEKNEADKEAISDLINLAS